MLFAIDKFSFPWIQAICFENIRTGNKMLSQKKIRNISRLSSGGIRNVSKHNPHVRILLYIGNLQGLTFPAGGRRRLIASF